jgi:HEAT repeat protein
LLLQEAENALGIASAKIPVLVELRYLPSEANESSVCDRILAFMHKHDPALDIDEVGIKQLLRQGRLLLLVDGVNELPSNDGRVMVNQFRELYQKTCPMIFTTRELSAGGDLGIAKRLEMQPLTEPQMQQFVMAYLPTQGERLLRQLSGRLREFGQTPLLLWMLCSLFQHPEFKGQIPPNLGMVFRAFTMGYGDRIKQDVMLSKDSRAWWGRLLQYLAFKMTCGESLTELQVAISRREAEQILVEFLRGKVEFADDCAVQWLGDLLKHHLIQISNDRIEFRHQLIQEYYAAEWLLGLLPSLSDARLRQGYLNYLKWTEPLALMLELVESEEQAVRVVRLALEVDLRLGARLAGAVKYGFQEKTVGLLVQEIEERKIPNLYAIELFGKTRSDVAIKFLIQSIKYRDYLMHMSETKVLGKFDSVKVIELLIQSLKDRDSNLRRNSVEILGNIGSEKVVDDLILALKDQSSDVRGRAARALGIIGSEKAVEHLTIALEDQDSYVMLSATNALKNFVNKKGVEPMTLAIKDDDFDVLVNKSHLNEAQKIGELASGKTVENLIQAIKYKNFVARGKAIEKIGKSSFEEAFMLTESYKIEESFVRRAAADALIKIDSEKATKYLIQTLKDRDIDVRRDTVNALGKIGSEKAVEHLIQTLKDRDIDVRRDAVNALGKIGSEKAVEHLIQTLKDRDTDVRRDAVNALGKIGSEKAVEHLIQALKNQDFFVRRDAVKALGKIGSEKAVEHLIQELKEQNNYHMLLVTAQSLEIIVAADRNLPSLTQQLPHLLTLIPTEANQQALSVITAIQSRCKYYNYDIAQTPLPPEDNPNPTIGNTYNFYDKVGQVVEKLTVQRDNIATQNNQKTAPES